MHYPVKLSIKISDVTLSGAGFIDLSPLLSLFERNNPHCAEAEVVTGGIIVRAQPGYNARDVQILGQGRRFTVGTDDQDMVICKDLVLWRRILVGPEDNLLKLRGCWAPERRILPAQFGADRFLSIAG